MQQPSMDRRARGATLVAFATNGALPTSLLARYAEVKDMLGVDAAMFGLLVAGFMLGAAGAFQVPGWVLRHIGSRWTTFLGTAWVALALLAATVGVVSGHPWAFLIGLMFAGFGDAVVDVAQNSQGLRVQKAYGRSVLSSMHAGWSIGAATGGLIGTAAASLGVPLVAHLGIWGIICTVVMGWSARAFLPDQVAAASEEATGSLGRRAMWMLAPLALVALAGISVEDIGNN